MPLTTFVSIICPVYNAERFLAQTIHSVLGQTYPHWELLLIIDAKSSDQSASLAQSFSCQDHRIQTIEHSENLGVAKNRNFGIKRAKGKYIAFLDSDDLWSPFKLALQIQYMENHSIEFSCHSYGQMNSEGHLLPILRKCPPKISYKDLLKTNHIGCLTVMVRSTFLKEHEFLPEVPHEDFLLWLELLKKIPFAYGMNENLATYRVLPNSRSGNKKRAALDRWHLYRNILKLNLVQSLVYYLYYAYHALKVRWIGNQSSSL